MQQITGVAAGMPYLNMHDVANLDRWSRQPGARRRVCGPARSGVGLLDVGCPAGPIRRSGQIG